MKESYVSKTYFGLASDPVHIGTGGYTLGRVDNPILRDFDGVPKIPGTSIEGTARTFAYFKELGGNKACAVGKKIKIRIEGKEEEKEPCGHCRLCISFGFTKEERSLHGMAQFSDARILFFPVTSFVGPVWVTSPSRLRELNVQQDKDKWGEFERSESCIASRRLKGKLEKAGYLNFGWLLLKTEQNTHEILPEAVFGGGLKFSDRGLDKKEIFERLVIVSDSVYKEIVNTNLEVRTSVAIDPATGAAESGALFTYEAIPRATVLYFDIVYQDPRYFDVAKESGIEKVDDVIKTVEEGLKLSKYLGIGGMQTRGFGKLDVLGLDGYDPIELAEIEVKNAKERLKEIEEGLKSAPEGERRELEREKGETKKRFETNAEQFAKLAMIYGDLKDD
ncbi:MAG: type III-B CRISPR module RAMP protein Cmr4 [Candidatus Methanospirareceae archaeon]